MEAKEEMRVGGFLFGSVKDVEIAKSEQEKIAYMEKRMHYERPDSVLLIYNKTIENRVFQTPVGYLYLYKLQQFLLSKGFDNDVKSIPMYQVFSYDVNEELPQRKTKRRVQSSQYRELRGKLRISVMINLLLFFMVAVMFVIALTGKNPTIMNYESKLTNQYAGWEQELTDREAVIREKEKELQIESPE